MKILVTGAAGFIGFHLSDRLLRDGHEVVGIDNLNDYYDPALKKARLELILGHQQFEFQRLDLVDAAALGGLVAGGDFDRVVHLGAQAGVRHSIEHPESYIQSNLVGFANVLEACRAADTPHLVFASSSSVYGATERIPFTETDRADRPVSLYAATKRANELMAYSYASLHGMPMTGLRFFTAYGPWGRPDMALFLFTRAILAGEPIQVFNHGRHRRDFTYIDDVVEGIMRVVDADPGDIHGGPVPYRVYNIGNGQPVKLDDFIACLEDKLGRKAIREDLPAQPGEVRDTWADCSAIEADFNYQATTSLEKGVSEFVDWYLGYYGEPDT